MMIEVEVKAIYATHADSQGVRLAENVAFSVRISATLGTVGESGSG
jgi:ABC-type oligopeptide transport system ATPase subunit